VARRQLAVLLNLPADVTPTASDPIVVQPRWPLDLEASLLEAYRGNPELEAILATRTALAQQSQATAAGLLPRLSLFASAGGSSAQTSLGDFDLGGGGCCGSTALPLSTTSGWDWSVGLAFTWLLFDAGTTAGQARALAKLEAAAAQQYAASRNDIRLRIEQAFFNHEASLAKLSSARRGVAAAVEAFRDVRLRYQTGLSSEIDLSVTQDRLISSLVQRLNATVNVNVTYARLLKELLPVPRDPAAPIQPQLQLSSAGPGQP
jgi:outer membrane protein TolC